MLVYTDNERKEYRLKDFNGYEIYRVDYYDGRRKYMVYENVPIEESGILEYFWTLKEAREYAKTH